MVLLTSRSSIYNKPHRPAYIETGVKNVQSNSEFFFFLFFFAVFFGGQEFDDSMNQDNDASKSSSNVQSLDSV